MNVTTEHRDIDPGKQITIEQAKRLANGLPTAENIERFETDFVYAAAFEIHKTWQDRPGDYPITFNLQNWPRVNGPRFLTWGQLKLRAGINQDFIDAFVQVEADTPLICFIRPHPIQAKIYRVPMRETTK
jgi:hypothetical protein